MPELSRFFGIIIRMFAEPLERHHSAHFHAYYQEHVAAFSISPVALISGSIPQRQQRLVEAWAELRHDERLNEELPETFLRWYPGMQANEETQSRSRLHSPGLKCSP